MIRTCWPDAICPASRSACSAVQAEVGTAAACSKVRLAGLSARVSSRRGGVLGEGTVAGAEHLVADLEPGHVLADRLDRSSDIEAADTAPWAHGDRSP